MAKGWHRESRRHALARRGIKTAIDDKPINRVPVPKETYYEDEQGTLRGRCPVHGEFIGDAIGCPKCFGEGEERDARIDEEKQHYANIEEIKNELRPIKDFTQVIWNEEETKARVSLKKGISFNEFQKFFPDIKKKQLVRLFDYLDDNQDVTVQAIKELRKEDKPRPSPPIPDTPSRFEAPPLGYDDWEQFQKEYGNEVDEYGD